MINNKTYKDYDYDNGYDYSQKQKKVRQITQEEIDRMTNALISKQVDYKDTLGFMSDEITYNKFDKSSGAFVSYQVKDGKTKVLVSKIGTIRDFNSEKAVNYFSEIL